MFIISTDLLDLISGGAAPAAPAGDTKSVTCPGGQVPVVITISSGTVGGVTVSGNASIATCVELPKTPPPPKGEKVAE
jgi:hypothetical protein